MAMHARASMARQAFARLSQRIAEIEGRSVCLPAHRARLPFSIRPLDAMLSGGLRRDALHEIRSTTTRDSVAAAGFAVALLARLGTGDHRPFLLVSEAGALDEAGHPYGPGLERFGLDPTKLVVVRSRRPAETLWVFEEALRCRALAAVLAEIRGHPHQLDLTASRRLALRARESGVMGLLLRQAGAAESGAATTRWHVTPRPAAILDHFTPGIGRPAWRLALERNRNGSTGIFDLEWNHGSRAFALAEPVRPALPLSRASLSGDRPHPSADAGTIVAFRRAS
jgi:protein ImuA